MQSCGNSLLSCLQGRTPLEGRVGGTSCILSPLFCVEMPLSSPSPASIVFLFRHIIRPQSGSVLYEIYYNVRRLIFRIILGSQSDYDLSSKSICQIDQRLGYGYFQLPSDFIAELSAESQSILASRKQYQKFNSKPYLRSLTRLSDYPKDGPTYQFATSTKVICSVTNYFLSKPVLWDIVLLESPVQNNSCLHSDGFKGSQLWHLDAEDKVNIKIWIPFHPIDMSCGPTHFIPKNLSRTVRRTLHCPRGKKVTDDQFYSLVHPHDVIPFTSNGQTCLMVDTCNCFHMGSRIVGAVARRLLMIHYVSHLSDYII